MLKYFQKTFYLFIGEACYMEEWILCQKYKYIPIFYHRSCFVNVCIFFFCIKESDASIEVVLDLIFCVHSEIINGVMHERKMHYTLKKWSTIYITFNDSSLHCSASYSGIQMETLFGSRKSLGETCSYFLSCIFTHPKRIQDLDIFHSKPLKKKKTYILILCVCVWRYCWKNKVRL